MSMWCDGAKRAEEHQAGIALIVVLGLLSVLTLMAVAFSISMRTERSAASAYVDTVRARQLVDVALARVLVEEIPASVTDNAFSPDWNTYPYSVGGVGTNFLMYKGSNYTPGVLHSAARAGDVLNWIDIRDPSTDHFYGQYAYMIVNNTGLLDANVVAGSNRNYGTHPAEIQIAPEASSDPSFLLETVQGGDLRAYRDIWFGRFETLPELYALGTWNPNEIPESAPFNSGSYVDHFHIFSHFPVDTYVEPSGTPFMRERVNIGGAPEDWNDADILAALTDGNRPFSNADDARDFLNQMKDYASESYIPENAEGLSFKRVPMINEVALTNTIELVVDPVSLEQELILRSYVVVETWFPFPEAIDSPTFQVSLGDDALRIAQIFPGNLQPLVDSFAIQGATAVDITPSHGGIDDNEFVLTQFEFEGRMRVNCADPADCPAPPPGMGLRFQLDAPIQVTYLGQPVDHVGTGWPLITVTVSPASFPDISTSGAKPLGNPVAYSVVDPRVNWSPADHWDSEAMTLTNRNVSAEDFADSDEYGIMYCRQAPIESVGELSYLLFRADQPWETVRLLAPETADAAQLTRARESAHLVDRFTVHEETARAGLVNINTPYAPVLQAVLYHAPVEFAPQRSGVDRRVSVDEAVLIADEIASRADGNLRNLSDLVGLGAGTDELTVQSVLDHLPGISNPGKFTAESVIRNSMELLGTRSTMYTVYLMARVFPSGYDPDSSRSTIDLDELGVAEDDIVLSEQRAVALVWRDPAVNDSGENRAIVRSFIWLSENDD
jgi:hypothetical protein